MERKKGGNEIIAAYHFWHKCFLFWVVTSLSVRQ